MYSDDAGEIQLLDFPPAARKANNEIILAIFPREDARRETSSPKAKMESFWRRKCTEFCKDGWFILKMVFRKKLDRIKMGNPIYNR